MQEEIEYLQGRMLDAYSLKELDQQMQDRVTTLVDNNTKLGNVQRKQIKGVQAKIDQLEAGYSLITEEQSEQLAAKIAQYLETDVVQDIIERNLTGKLESRQNKKY